MSLDTTMPSVPHAPPVTLYARYSCKSVTSWLDIIFEPHDVLFDVVAYDSLPQPAIPQMCDCYHFPHANTGVGEPSLTTVGMMFMSSYRSA